MLNQTIIPELQHEAASTRKMLERVPFENTDWKPHDKSMSISRLAAHVAELPSWATMIVNTPELNFATFNYKPFRPVDNAELLRFFDDNVKAALEALQGAGDALLMEDWTLRNGDHIIMKMPRVATIRSMAMNHLIHHRGQLSVFLRLKDVAVPGMYGPSADERQA